MPSCCINNCNNYTGQTHGTKNIKYFCFPKNEKLKEKWLISLESNVRNRNTETCRVCEKHFENDCFVMKKTKNEFKSLKRLKPDAVPTINLNLPVQIIRRKEKVITSVKYIVPTYRELLQASRNTKDGEGVQNDNILLDNFANESQDNIIKRLLKKIEENNCGILKLKEENENLRKTIAQLQLSSALPNKKVPKKKKQVNYLQGILHKGK